MTTCTKYCPRGKLTQALVFRGFVLGQSARMTAHIADPSYSVFSFSGGQADTVWPKVPTVNHIVSINYLAWPQTLLRGKIFQGLRGYFPGTSQGPNLSLECAGFGQPRPAEFILYCPEDLIKEKGAEF